MRTFRPLIITLLIITVLTGVFFPGLVQAQAHSGGSCLWGFGWVCNMIGFIVYTIPVTLTSWILWLSGVFLNSVLQYTVVDLRGNLESITGINVAWRTIRDLANISFIFILLYAAINTILEREKDWKKTVTSIVIAAIFINFSLFFTKLIIDASNIVALTFYNQMIPNGSVTTGLPNYYLQPLGLSSFWAPGNTLPANMSLGNMFVMAVGSSVFFLITAFVFFAVSIMFLIRYVNIIFLLVLSPIAVLGSVFASGSIGSGVKKWWSILPSQMIFAPAYMIMTWVVITIINSPTFQRPIISGGTGGVTQTFSSMFDGNTSSIGLIMNFLIIIALAIGTLIVSKGIANQGSSAAQKLVGGALGFGVATAGLAGRNTAGRFGARLSRSTGLKDAADAGGAKGFASRLALKTSNAAAKSSFDIRATRAATGFDKVGQLSGMGSLKDVGLDMKAGGKGGIQKWRDDRTKELQKKYEERAKLYGANTEEEKEELKKRRQEEEDELKAKIKKIDETGVLNSDQITERTKYKSRLEEIGVVDQEKLDTLTDKSKKEEYKKNIETTKKDLESGQNRVKNEAQRVADKSTKWFTTFSVDEARRKALANIKKGGEKKPEEILKEAIEKEAKKKADEEKDGGSGEAAPKSEDKK